MKVDKTKEGKDLNENNDTTYRHKRTWSCIWSYWEQNRSVLVTCKFTDTKEEIIEMGNIVDISNLSGWST